MKRVAVLTSSRADFGHLHWPLRRMLDHPALDPRLIIAGAHLSAEFGVTVREIESAGFRPDETIECLISSDTDVGMAKTIGVATLSLADLLGRMRPDILLLIADRYEMLAPASVALALRIPIAHIEGGEISEGAIDDAVRNALTKMAHLHFTPTEDASRRVMAMGEESWRVHRVGAPSLDHLAQDVLPDGGELAGALGFVPDENTCVAVIHPVTLQDDPTADAEAMIEALAACSRIAFCFPNADAGSRSLIRRVRTVCESRRDAHLYVNLEPRLYWGLLGQAGVLVGNSSSGIMETASIGLPTVNVGERQRGRTRPGNVIDTPAEASAIRSAIEHARSPGFRSSLQGLENPYGDGHAGERIARILAEAPERGVLLHKRALPLSATGFDHD